MASQLSLYTPPDSSNNVFHTQEQVVFQKIEMNKYCVTLSDYNNCLLSNFSLRLTLPEVRGVGKVSFVKNFLYLYIKEFRMDIINRDNTRVILPTLNGYDLLRIAENNISMTMQNDKMNKMFCRTRIGRYPDSVIFEKQDVYIHIALPFEKLNVLPKTQLEVNVELEDIHTLLTYNSDFIDSLSIFVREASLVSKNLTLQYVNYQSAKQNETILLHFNRTTHDHDTMVAITETFEAAMKMLVYVKPTNFQTTHKYLMNPEDIIDEDVLKNRAIDNFKSDLIKTDITLSADARIKYIEIPASGIVKFRKTPHNCHVEILNKPDDIKFYFHSNILSYCRRSDTTSATNISEYFRKIRVIYTPETLIIKVLEHEIPLELLCIPISFWSDPTNTSTGDLRSDSSKKNDFYYQNSFLNSIDFLNSTVHIESVILTIPNRQLAYEAKGNLQGVFRRDQLDNIIEIPLGTPQQPIRPEPHRFERFKVSFNWKLRPYQMILQLYRLIPIVEIIERSILVINHDKIEMRNSSF